MEWKMCSWCEETFKAHHKKQMYCGPECKKLAQRERDRQRKLRAEGRTTSREFLKGFYDAQAFIDKHYEETGIRLSYGKAEALRKGLIKNA